MKLIALGDTHGRRNWKTIVNKEEFDVLIFIGDYFDSFYISAVEQIANFKDICEYKRTSGKEVVMLIGNHDHHYFHSIGYTGTSGYQSRFATSIGIVLEENKDLLQMAYSSEKVLFTHAGVGEDFLDITFGKDGCPLVASEIADKLNELWKHKPRSFIFNGRESSGDSMGQTPIWIRPRSLMLDSQVMKQQGIIQVVGHTTQNQIDILGKATGGKYFFIDTLETSGEYLIIEDGKFSTGNSKDEKELRDENKNH